MIDYEKLQLAHELTTKLPYQSFCFECWCSTGFDSGFFYVLTFEYSENLAHEYESENIDELISKLKEFLLKPKYKIGHEAWCIYNNTAKKVEIIDLNLHADKDEYHYEMKEPRLWWHESSLYPTKEALIAAQSNTGSPCKNPNRNTVKPQEPSSAKPVNMKPMAKFTQ